MAKRRPIASCCSNLAWLRDDKFPFGLLDLRGTLYWRGKAKQLNGIAGGNADVGAAEKIDPGIAAQP